MLLVTYVKVVKLVDYVREVNLVLVLTVAFRAHESNVMLSHVALVEKKKQFYLVKLCEAVDVKVFFETYALQDRALCVIHDVFAVFIVNHYSRELLLLCYSYLSEAHFSSEAVDVYLYDCADELALYGVQCSFLVNCMSFFFQSTAYALCVICVFHLFFLRLFTVN